MKYLFEEAKELNEAEMELGIVSFDGMSLVIKGENTEVVVALGRGDMELITKGLMQKLAFTIVKGGRPY